MTEKACALTGHRTLPGGVCDLRNILITEIKRLVSDYNTNVFLCGGARGFDMLAAEAIISLRTELTEIRLVMVLPCREQDKYWTEKDRLRYSYILSRADDIIYISDAYDDTCMFRRNRFLIDNSSVCLCYQKAKGGGTAYTVNYARKNNRRIINLADGALY